MTAPTQAQIVQGENPNDAASFRYLALDSKSVLASLLAFLIFAPGCAAATVFLLRADDRMPPLAAPRLHTPQVAKSDRLPPAHWSPDAIEMLLGPKGEARIDAATVFEDPASFEPMLIRGSITLVSENTHAIADAMALAPRPKAKRESRRARPEKVMAEAAPPPEPPPPPTFLEKLFGTRVN